MKWLWLLAMAFTGGAVVVSACGGSVGNVVPGQDASLVGATDTGAPDILTGGQEASGDDGSGGVDAGGARDAADASDGAIEAGCDTQFDPRNCGVCGHDCAGGACSSGICVPLPAGVLASGQRLPAGIAVDATNIYWVTEGGYNGPPGKSGGSFLNSQLLKCAKGGCDNRPTVLASGLGQPVGHADFLLPVFVSGSDVYWGAQVEVPDSGFTGQVVRCATGGCNGMPLGLWSAQGWPNWFTLNGDSVFFALTTGADRNVGQIVRCPFSGCDPNPVPLASGLLVSGVAADSTNVYWADQQQRVLKCAIGGCGGNPSVVATGQSATSAIAATGTYVYWTNGTSGSVWGPVMSCPIACNNNPTPLTPSNSNADGLAIDSANAYWTQPFDGLVVKCALSGCTTSTTIASGQNSPSAIAVDDQNVYWTTTGSHGTDGEIRMAPK
jgi:hypothetical protein